MKPFKRENTTQIRERLQPCDILILTGSVGSGHISAARAITEAIHRMHGNRIHVDTVDLLSTLSNFVTKTAKTIYLGSLKISPKFYELIFQGSADSKWPLKILNFLSAPFMQEKILELFEKKHPKILVSTYPIWDILVKKVWERYSKHLPFVSVITDSINIHPSWITGNPDYFIVANEDTKTALKNLGVSRKYIKVFGYPTSQLFLKHHDCMTFKQKLGLSANKKTLLLILSTGIKWSKVKRLTNIIQKSGMKNLQLVIVASADAKWKKYLDKISWPWPTYITGWTNEMHSYIHGADIVLTKAGGATVMECITSKKPMIIIEAIPGQEIGNAMLVQKYNLGAILNEKMDNFDSAVQYIFQNKNLIEKNLAAQQKPHSTEDIAKFLVQLTGL